VADLIELLSSGDAVRGGRAQSKRLDSAAVILETQALGALHSTDGQQGSDGNDIDRPQDGTPACNALQELRVSTHALGNVSMASIDGERCTLLRQRAAKTMPCSNGHDANPVHIAVWQHQ
jgi:hypothetical protein